MDCSAIFPMQLSEFIRSLNFGSNMKKNCIKKRKNLLLHLKIIFLDEDIFFFIYNKEYSDRSELDLSNETIRIPKFYFCQKL